MTPLTFIPGLTLISTLAFLVERVIEWIGEAVPQLPPSGKLALSIGLGLGMAFGMQVNVFLLVGYTQGYPLAGQALTGIVIAGGSNFVNAVWNRLRVVSLPAAPARVVADADPVPPAR